MTKLTIDSQDASLESRRRRDIIVIGASAAALNALPVLLAALPATAPVAVFVAVGGFRSRDRLDHVLGRFSGLPVRYARDAEPVACGQVLVAPPGHHLRLHPDRVEVARAPRRQPVAAAIDLLLHSAATSFADRVCALVLSSNPDEWNAGLLAVKNEGGLCALQDPRHSLWPEMPRGAALRDVCGVLPIELMSQWALSVATEPAGSQPAQEEHDRRIRLREALRAAIRVELDAASAAARLADCKGLAGQPAALRQFSSREHFARVRAGLLSKRVLELSPISVPGRAGTASETLATVF
jgi:CheB methylesterase